MDTAEFRKRFANILFVTTPTAHQRINVTGEMDQLRALAGSYFLTLPLGPTPSFDETFTELQDERQKVDTVDGVVLLGNYDELPPYVGECITSDVREAVVSVEDKDNWCVHSDHVYGGAIGKYLPISRYPITPQPDYPLLPKSVASPATAASSQAIRSSEFLFAGSGESGLAGGAVTGPMHISPPTRPCKRVATADCLAAGSFQAPHLYVMLHGRKDDASGYSGVGENDEFVALNRAVLADADYSGAVVLSGVCWGGRIDRFVRLDNQTDQWYVDNFNQTDYLCLDFVARGANAYVGFTGSHWVPTATLGTNDLSAPLHRWFWTWILQGDPPAVALFKARQQLRAQAMMLPQERRNFAGKMKSYWSATCLGIGW